MESTGDASEIIVHVHLFRAVGFAGPGFEEQIRGIGQALPVTTLNHGGPLSRENLEPPLKAKNFSAIHSRHNPLPDGPDWNCVLGTLTCTRSDVLVAGSSYATITLTVDVSGSAAASVTNTATVSGGGDVTPGNNTATDPTTVLQPTRVWTTEGSNGTIDEDSTAIVTLNDFAAGLQPGQTGVGRPRYNIMAARGISRFCPATSSGISIRLRDSDASPHYS